MKAFHTVAVPHDDILKRRMDMSVFAADLWDTFRNKGSEEYTDAKTFFKKTHMTKNLQNLLEDIRAKLQENRGDSFQHIETPFGGGKTHAMIAMYHKSKEWRAKPVVIVGTSLSTKDTIWGMIEKQLNGKIDKLAGNHAPGREKLRQVLEGHGPILILIDELLSYAVTAAGVKVGNTTLTAMTHAFIQQLSEEVATIPNVCVVASFPASALEIPDQKLGEELLRMFGKVAGRKERKVTPVDPNDVPNIIRSRLFETPESEIVKNAENVIDQFADYCEKESILPPGKSQKEYREKFEHTYPFLPDVIDTLYQKWGSFGSFQRTRGVLRLLSLVVHSLKNSDRPYITLADFDLEDNEIRRELLVHIGDKYDSVITKDISDQDSGARRSEDDIAPSLKGLRLGTKTATTIFLSSFSIGGVNGATMGEIKRSTSDPGMTSAVIDGVVGNFRNKMSYMKSEENRHLFSSEPNINRIKMDKMESIRDEEVRESERLLLEKNKGGDELKVLLWPKSSGDVDDSPRLKLVVLQENDHDVCADILENKGGSPRIRRNAVLFLCPLDSERSQFVLAIKEKIALGKIRADTPNLKPEQKKEIDAELKKSDSTLEHQIRKYYRTVYVPESKSIEKYDMGVPAVGEPNGLSEMVLERLKAENQIHEKIGARILKEVYLKSQEFAKTAPMYESMLGMRGSRRPVSKNVVENSIMDGVREGMFGLGELRNDRPVCMNFKEPCSVAFSDDEVIIHDSICEQSRLKDADTNVPDNGGSGTKVEPEPEPAPEPSQDNSIKSLDFGFNIPEGKVSDTAQLLRLISDKFNTVEIRIKSRDGSVTEADKKRMQEALDQMGAQSDL